MEATERCSRSAASLSICLMSADVRIDKVSSFSRFMVLHPNCLVLQMYCVLNDCKFGALGDGSAGLKVYLFGHSRSPLGNQGLDINNPEQKYSLKARLVLGPAPAVHHVRGVPSDRSRCGLGHGLRSRAQGGDGAEKRLRVQRAPAQFHAEPTGRLYRFSPMSLGRVCGCRFG